MKYLSVSKQIPEYIRAEYPAFVEFITAYYKWLETEYSAGKIEELLDVDNTIDSFIQYFRKELDIYNFTDDKFLLRNIKQLYSCKGTSNSIDFIIKVLLGKTAQTVFPWDSVFKTSAAEWKQSVSIIISINSGSLNDFIGNSVNITDTAGNIYTTHIVDTSIRKDGFIELFIKRFFHYNNLVSVSTVNNTATGTIQKTIIKSDIINGGSGFSVGQIFQLNENGGSGTLLKVKSVDVNGKILSTELIKAGTGYSLNFETILSPNGEETVYQNGYARILSTVGEMFIYPGYYFSSNNVLGDLIYIQDSFYYQLYSYVTIIDESIDKYASLLRSIAHPVGMKHFGRYDISNNFSLTTAATPSLNLISKADAIRDYIYAIETITSFMFSKYLADTSTATETFVQQVNKALTNTSTATETFVQQVNKALADTSTATETFVQQVNKALADTSTTADVIQFAGNKIISDSIIVIESLIFGSGTLLTDLSRANENIILNLNTIWSDNCNITDQIFVSVPDKGFSDIVNVVDIIAREIDKYFSETVNITDTGTIYAEPFYVQPAYWEAGYFENERIID